MQAEGRLWPSDNSEKVDCNGDHLSAAYHNDEITMITSQRRKEGEERRPEVTSATVRLSLEFEITAALIVTIILILIMIMNMTIYGDDHHCDVAVLKV